VIFVDDATALRKIIAWLASRAGLAPLLVELDEPLREFTESDRYAIVRLLEEVYQHYEDRYPPHARPQPSPPAAPPPYQARDSWDSDADEDGSYARPAAPPPYQDRDSWDSDAEYGDGGSGAAVLDEDVQFTIYRPSTVRPARWHPLLAYVHRSTPFVDEDGNEVDPVAEAKRRAENALGPRAAFYGPVVTDSGVALPRGNEIVFEPWIDEGEFNPARAAIRWEEPIHEITFRFRVPTHADGSRLAAGMRVYLGVLLVAELQFIVRVDSAAAPVAESNDPVRAAPYRRIFASYSHRDTEVVARLRAAAAAFGDSYLIDLDNLRAGEAWEPRLAELITQADVFQLFWSKNSMRSKFVRQEWEHALSLNRAHFVRPVYWEDPRPEDPDSGLPPEALDRLQFCRLQAIAVSPGSDLDRDDAPSPIWPGVGHTPDWDLDRDDPPRPIWPGVGHSPDRDLNDDRPSPPPTASYRSPPSKAAPGTARRAVLIAAFAALLILLVLLVVFR
jgi:hypothetical protein